MRGDTTAVSANHVSILIAGIVLSKDIIDFTVDVDAYMRIRTPRPRYFRLEGGQVEPFG